MDFVLAELDRGTRWLWLLERLDTAAHSRKIFGLIPPRTNVVASQATIVALVHHYARALPGKTYICYGAPGSGKTMAATYLIRGDFNIRPRRAIMIGASDSNDDVAGTMAHAFNAPAASPDIHHVLVRALVPEELRQPIIINETNSRNNNCNCFTFLAKFRSNMIDCCCSRGSLLETNHTVRVWGENESPRRTTPMRPHCNELPLLILDGLSKSDANADFVSRLAVEVSNTRISALILVKDELWANELIRNDGGVKVLPVDQVISNPRGDNVDQPFTEEPKWNGMTWGIDDLATFAALEGITDVKLRDGMTPEQVLDLHENQQISSGIVTIGC